MSRRRKNNTGAGEGIREEQANARADSLADRNAVETINDGSITRLDLFAAAALAGIYSGRPAVVSVEAVRLAWVIGTAMEAARPS